MSGTQEKHDFKQAVAFVSRLSGLPEQIIKVVIKAYCTYLLLQLYIGKTVYIPKVGRIQPIKGRKTEMTAFKASHRLKRFLYLNKEVNFQSVLESYQKYLNSSRHRDVLEEYNTYSLEVIEQTFVTLKRKDYAKSYTARDTIRLSLLRYLQRDFTYGLPWQHPYRKNELYTAERIEKKLRQYRGLDPEGYAVLYSLWLNVGERNIFLRQQHLTRVEVVEQMHRVLDSLLLLLVFTDFEPEGLEVAYRMGILEFGS